MNSTAGGRGAFAVCFVAGMCEGYDLMVAGVAAPRFARLFGLEPQHVGLVFAAAGIGLLFGAVIGGRLADLVGRRAVLVASLILMGLFSLGSAFAPSFSMLLVMRFLTGLGLGGALPNILAIVNETSPPGSTAIRVTIVGSAMPIGGAMLGLLNILLPALPWQSLFLLGGVAPLLIAVGVQRLLPPFRVTLKDRSNAPTSFAFFAGGRTIPTLALWVTTFCVGLSVSMLINWLPSLMISRSFDVSTVGRIVMMLTLGGAASGFAFGLLAKSAKAAIVYGTAWAGMITSLLVMQAAGNSATITAVAVFGLGFFLSGGQFLLYGAATDLYPRLVRGTGTGFAVGIGRLGAIVGPLLAGVLIFRTGSASVAVLALLPIVTLSFVTVGLLQWLRTRPVASTALRTPV